MNLLGKLEQHLNAIKNSFSPKDDSTIRDSVIQLLHDYYKGNLLQSFLYIEQLNKEQLQREKQLLYQGVEDGMHGLTSLSKHLLEDKKGTQAKIIAEMYFIEDNIAYIINIAKAYFPDGKPHECSNNGKWFLDKFKELLIRHKNKYLEGGKSYQWAIDFNHLDYIKLILSNNE